MDGALVEAAALCMTSTRPRSAAPAASTAWSARAARVARLPRARDAGRLPPLHALLDDDRHPIGWPSVLVAVADRHVAQEFMTVDERLDDMKMPSGARRSIETARRPAHALDEQVAEATGLSVDDLVARLRAAWESGRERRLLFVHGDDGFGLDGAVRDFAREIDASDTVEINAASVPDGAIERAQLEAGTMSLFGTHLTVSASR